MGQGHTIGLVAALLLLITPITFALAEEPPSSLDDELKTIVNNAYNLTYVNRGWGSVNQLPQSQFSVDDLDFYDNAAEFGEVGYYQLGLENLLNPQYDGLDLNQNITENMLRTAQSTLPWVWTPADVTFGVHDSGRMPHNGIAIVREKLDGIAATDHMCVETSIAFNQWGVPKDTLNKQTTTLLSSLAGAGTVFLTASQQSSSPNGDYMRVATGIGDMFLGMIVTPEGESFGIHPSQVTDEREYITPLGMMPYQFLLKNEADTLLCSDGGTIKLNENRKTHIAQAALFLQKLGTVTNEDKYTRAADILAEGILALQECDGTYKDYTRWEGPGVVPTTCTPSDGSAAYEPYPANVIVGESNGFITDTSLILYFLGKQNPNLYNENAHYKRAAVSLLTLEERDTGGGIARDGDALKYASYSVNTQDRAFAQLALGTVLLRASCAETDDALEARLQKMAYTLFDKAGNLIPAELDYKIGNAISPDVGTNVLAASMAADAWKIITQGCEDCKDNDGDGYIDGVCAKDTVKYDCNDSDAAIHPGASETCDNIDNDCDGKVDNGFDEDNDGVSTCAEPKDCNDAFNQVYPGAIEKIDNIDNDCDGTKDNTGIEITLQNDANIPLSNIEVVFIDYGNACANSFNSLTENITQIKAQCTTASTCTTNENGMCLATFKRDGKYQALANITPKGVASLPLEFQVGRRVPLVLKADVNVAMGTTDDANSIQNNPALMAIIFYTVFGGALLIGWSYIRNGVLFPTKKGKDGPYFKAEKTPPKGPGFFDKLKLPTLPKIENKSGSLTIRVPKISASKLADKIVHGKIPGNEKGEKILSSFHRPGNFPKKTPTHKPKRVWKDD